MAQPKILFTPSQVKAAQKLSSFEPHKDSRKLGLVGFYRGAEVYVSQNIDLSKLER